jgi:hypothetical protein
MAYIGNGPGSIRQGRRAVYEFTSTANQTAFSGTDENGLTLDLLQANDNDVYLNGVRLIITDDYTISGDVLTLTSGAASGDKLIIMTQDEIANDASYSKAASDSRYINYDGDIVNGTIQMGGSGNNITFADNNKAVFGDDSDLEIYSDGTTGQLAGNVNVTGTVTSDGMVVDGSTPSISNGTSPAAFTIGASNGAASSLILKGAAGMEMQTYNGGWKKYFNLAYTGDIGFYNAAGTDAKLFWDASDERLGIGNTAPSYPLDVEDSTSGFIKASFVSTGSSHSSIVFDNTGSSANSVRVGSNNNDFYVRTSGAEKMRIDASGQVGIGTQTPTHKLDVAGTTKAEQYLLDAIAKDISTTANDVFIYDTRKDSDGGAWRKRTQHTSWYSETLNTATRGARKEFPAVAVIVAEINQVTIYDGDDPDLPMWMVFNQGGAWSSSANLIMPTSPDPVSISFLNGILSIAYNSGYGVGILDFISESKTTIFANNVTSYNGNVSQRNDGLGHSSASDARRIVNSATNDVAMTVLPNAPIDAATGLPVPTIAVATNGGVSVIKDNGTVVDITAGAGSNYSGASFIDITENYNLIFEQDSSSNSRAVFCIPIPTADRTTQTSDGSITDKVIMKFYPVGSHVPYPCFNGGGVVDAIRMAGDNQALKSEPGDLTLLEPNLADPELGKVAYITSDYNTGWMNGDIKLATLSDTDTTNLGTELVTNGTFTSNVTGWSTNPSVASWSSVSGQAVLVQDANSSSYWAWQEVTVVGGKTYRVSIDVISTTNTSYFRVGSGGEGSETYLTVNGIGTGTTTRTFTVPAGVTSVFINVGVTISGTIVFDNVSLKEDVADRSVNGNGLQVFGTVTKSKGGSDRDIVSYGGFDHGDYLQQPYNSSLDFSGDFCIQTWMYIPSDTTAAAYHYGYTSDQDQAILALYVAGQGLRTYTRESGGNWNYIQSSVPLNSWIHVTHQRKSGIVSTSINGILTAGSYTHTANLTRSGNVITLGRRIETTQTTTYWRGSLALFRLSNTALSQEQIKKIYNDEKFLFQENAKATLYGSSDAVTALAYDDDTELLHAGTSAGRSVFQGLRRIDNTTDAVGAAISASNGMVAED